MSTESLSPEIIELLKSVSSKRARIVIEHILEHGFITTEELNRKYGYEQHYRVLGIVSYPRLRGQGSVYTFGAKVGPSSTIGVRQCLGGDPKVEEGGLVGKGAV